MKVISPILKKLVYPTLSAAGLLRPRANNGHLSIVTYHGLRPAGYDSHDPDLDGTLILADDFREQLGLLKSRYQVISPEDFLSWTRKQLPLPAFSVLLTCDDGLQNTLTDMLPILMEEELRCLFFVTGASADECRTMLWYEELYLLFQAAPPGPFRISSEGMVFEGQLKEREQRRTTWWEAVRQLSQICTEARSAFLQAARAQFRLNGGQEFNVTDQVFCRRFGLLTATELRQLTAAGMTIGAHTMSHPLLSQAPPELAYFEISECKARLESVLQTEVWAMAYPFGGSDSVTPEVLEMPRRAGYEAAFLNFGGGLGCDLPLYALPRVHVSAGMRLGDFEAHVSGFQRRLQGIGGRS